MVNDIMRRLAAATLLFSIVACAILAVPARPSLKVRTLPDGSTIMVSLVGDEHHHAYKSEDGHFLTLASDGFFYYTGLNSRGDAVASDVRAHDIAVRQAAELDYVSAIDDEDVRMAVVHEREVTMAAPTARRMPMRRKPARQDTSDGLVDGKSFPTTGDQRGIVILVQYADVKFGGDSVPAATIHDNFSRMLNEEGYSDHGGRGSARDYFIASSNGLFRPTFDVYGPITLAHTMKYYGGNDAYGSDQAPEEMVIEACQQLNPTVDFRQYDRDADGVIDYVYVFYAGLGEADGGSDNSVWPHSWDVRETGDTYKYDGLVLGPYACSNEHDLYTSMTGIGTITHEFSHVLGLPDTYATDYSTALTPGSWDILDMGPYNGDGRVPPVYNAYERYEMGWLTPREFTEPATIALSPLTRTNEAYIVHTDKENEYFLVENRQQEGWDEYIPGHGMLVWHIDFNQSVWDQNSVNNTSSHQYVDIVEADGIRTENTRAGDAFPGNFRVTSLTDETRPSMLSWSSKPTERPITNIAEVENIVYFDVMGGGDGVWEQQRAVASDATDVTRSGFTAHWQPTDGATAYEIELHQMTSRSVGIAFFDGDKSSLGDLFTSNKTSTSNIADYAGESAPSLTFSARGDYLQTAEFIKDIIYLSFHLVAGTAKAVSNRVALQFLVGDEWISYASLRPDMSGKTFWYSIGTENDIPEGAKALRLEYQATKTGNVYVDDVMVLVGYYPADNDSTRITATVDGATTQLTLDTLTAGIEYGYRVRALRGEQATQWSAEVSVVTTDEPQGIAISTVDDPATDVEAPFYDILGRRVPAAVINEVSSGVYVSRSRKILVR